MRFKNYFPNKFIYGFANLAVDRVITILFTVVFPNSIGTYLYPGTLYSCVFMYQIISKTSRCVLITIRVYTRNTRINRKIALQTRNRIYYDNCVSIRFNFFFFLSKNEISLSLASYITDVFRQA